LVIPESTEEKDPFDLKKRRLKIMIIILKNIRKDIFFIEASYIRELVN